MDRLKEILSKLPVSALLVLYLLYLGYDLYGFVSDDSSPLLQKRAQIQKTRGDVKKTQEKVDKATEFYRTLDGKRAEIRLLAHELSEMQSTLSESLDVPGFLKTISTEAAKVGLKVIGLKPGNTKKEEYYTENDFELQFQGVYAQLYVFLDRLSRLEKIVRVDNFDVRRKGSPLSNYVDIEGKIVIRTFQYLGSKADEVAKTSSTAQAIPNAAAAPGKTPASAPVPMPGPSGTPAAGGGH